MSADNYIRELVDEIEILDPSKSMYTIQLLEEEIHRVQTKEKRKEEKEKLKSQKAVTLIEKVYVPTLKYPNYNFIGKLMGPRASTVKRIQAETKSSIVILGRGSTRFPEKEKKLSESDDPSYAHFKEPLHVSIVVKGFECDAHQHMAAALNEVNKYMDPENEEVKQESLRTLAMIVAPNKLKLSGVTPIIKVGIPPPGAILITDQTLGHKRVDAYKYEATFDGTYEGYPSSAPPPLADRLLSSPDSSDSETPLKRRKQSSDTYDPYGIL